MSNVFGTEDAKVALKGSHRFDDWRKGEMVLLLVQLGVEIKQEHSVHRQALRDLLIAYFDGLAVPPKPISRYNHLTKQVVDTGVLKFQHLLFRYLYKMRLYSADLTEDLMRQNEEQYGA